MFPSSFLSIYTNFKPLSPNLCEPSPPLRFQHHHQSLYLFSFTVSATPATRFQTCKSISIRSPATRCLFIDFFGDSRPTNRFYSVKDWSWFFLNMILDYTTQFVDEFYKGERVLIFECPVFVFISFLDLKIDSKWAEMWSLVEVFCFRGKKRDVSWFSENSAQHLPLCLRYVINAPFLFFHVFLRSFFATMLVLISLIFLCNSWWLNHNFDEAVICEWVADPNHSKSSKFHLLSILASVDFLWEQFFE